MRRIRIIPVLLLHKGGLVKSVQFKNYKYVGDPINAVKIFNEKGADELAIIDIDASREKRQPDFNKIAEIASEAFMPISYGGGITSLEQVQQLFYNGIEKVILNKSAFVKKELISAIASNYGSQSVVVSIDVKKNWLSKYKVFYQNGSINTGLDPVEFAKECVEKGAGEILINSIDNDGTFKGYDLQLIQSVAQAVAVPVIACGGASEITDFSKAINQAKASAVAAGSMFVFQKPHKAVLISYPSQEEFRKNFII